MTNKQERQKLTTLEMEIALMQELNVRQNLIVPNVQWGLVADLHECDLLVLSKSGYATEIEIKVSKADLMKDKKKKHTHDHELIKSLYFAVPENLKAFALENIPKKAGLYIVKKDMYVRCIRGAIVRRGALKWDNEQVLKLAKLGAMRILTLKRNINKLIQN